MKKYKVILYQEIYTTHEIEAENRISAETITLINNEYSNFINTNIVDIQKNEIIKSSEITNELTKQEIITHTHYNITVKFAD